MNHSVILILFSTCCAWSNYCKLSSGSLFMSTTTYSAAFVARVKFCIPYWASLFDETLFFEYKRGHFTKNFISFASFCCAILCFTCYFVTTFNTLLPANLLPNGCFLLLFHLFVELTVFNVYQN